MFDARGKIRFLILLAFAALIMLVVPTAALASDWPDPTFDRISTEVAGHPVHVFCDNSWSEWGQLEATAGLGPFDAAGFTFASRPVTYLDPEVCSTLHYLLSDGPRIAGIAWAGESIVALIHEAVHQSNWADMAKFYDEGLTDCTALSLLPRYAATFGFATTITTTTGHFIPVRNHKHRILRWRWLTSTATDANPEYTSLIRWAEAWHKARPPAYQGAC